MEKYAVFASKGKEVPTFFQMGNYFIGEKDIHSLSRLNLGLSAFSVHAEISRPGDIDSHFPGDDKIRRELETMGLPERYRAVKVVIVDEEKFQENVPGFCERRNLAYRIYEL